MLYASSETLSRATEDQLQTTSTLHSLHDLRSVSRLAGLVRR
jgi:hypothetical protein